MQSLNELSVGRFLGRYELLMPVAHGGMAAVWAARLTGTRGFQRVVAIKTILPSLSDDARFEQMFLDEAALASRVRHPNVVQVLDLGEEGGLLYQVMEWIDGEPLSAFFKHLPEGKGLPYPIAARILIGACDGLHAAHETRDDADKSVGLVHRDISPQNILVTRDGVPKVVDFGVVKASTLSSAATSSGTLKGKPAYMAPEQIQGEDIDRRADVFSLGVLLYIMTTSHHPFRGKNDMATLHNIASMDGPEPPSKYAKDYPDSLEQVVMMATSKDPEKRFASTAAMARALEAAVPGVNKVGDAEVAAFMRSLLSEKLEARSSALRQSLCDADERASQNPERRQSFGSITNPPTLQGLGELALSPPVTNPEVTTSENQTREGSTPAVDATTTEVQAQKSSKWMAISGGAAVFALAAAAMFFLVIRPRMMVKLPSSSVPAETLTTATPASPITPTLPSASSAFASDISVDSLPTATYSASQQPIPQPTTTTSLTSSHARARRPKGTASEEAPSTAAQQATSDPSATNAATSTATAAPTGNPKVPGTVPKIRDPGF